MTALTGATNSGLLRRFLTAALLVVLASVSAGGQQPLVGLIQGRIVDRKTQAPVPYAGLTATNIDSVEPGLHRRTTGADEKGFYQFVDVPEGRYSIVVTKRGYADYTIPLVSVHGGNRQHGRDRNVSGGHPADTINGCRRAISKPGFGTSSRCLDFSLAMQFLFGFIYWRLYRRRRANFSFNGDILGAQSNAVRAELEARPYPGGKKGWRASKRRLVKSPMARLR